MAESRHCPHCGVELAADVPHGLCPECLFTAGMQAAEKHDRAQESDDTSLYVAAFVPPQPAEIAGHFPQLEVLELLGQGGMGAVYKARQKRLDRLVALKVLPPGADRDPAFAERFTREARALARLNHPHIVGVHDFGEADGLYYFIMEFVDGANLRHVLEADQIRPAQALPIIQQVCEALQYAHEEGIVHRDIKPENILLDKKGRVKIADFGLAKLLGAVANEIRLTGTRQVMGTPHYMAPEQLEQPLAVDHRADIYSLGVVFYEMLTGELPLGRFALPSQKVAVDGRLDEVVLRALEKEPEKRYQHASDLQTDVAAITASGSYPVAVPVAPPGTGHPGGRTISVPFKCTGGLTEVRGLIRLDGPDLTLEFINHTLFFKSALKTKTIRVRDIAGMNLKKSRLTIRAHRFNVLEGIPGSSPGEVNLSIARNNREAAERLVSSVLGSGWADNPLPPAAPVPVESSRAPVDALRPIRAFAGRVKAFFRSVAYYCASSYQKSRASLLGPPRGAEDDARTAVDHSADQRKEAGS